MIYDTQFADLGPTLPLYRKNKHGSLGCALPYCELPIADAKDFRNTDSWLHSGDLASMDADGCVWIVDRKKDMILTRGYNVYPAEIERALAGHPDVALAAVGRLADEVKGEIFKACVVLKAGAVGDADARTALCKENLSAYKCPRAIQFVDDLPKTSTGKNHAS